MKFNIKSVTTVAAVFMVAMMLFAAPAAAAEHPAATTPDSDWSDDGATIEAEFNASADAYSIIEFETDTTLATEEVELNVTKNNATHAELDDLHSAFETIEEDDADGNDVHQFNVSHDMLETIPGDAGEEVTISVAIAHTYEDPDDETESVTDENEFEVTLEFADDHATVYLGDDSLDDLVDVETIEQQSAFDRAQFWNDPEEIDIASLDTDVGIVGSETTINVFADDGAVAGAFSETIDDQEAGDILLTQTSLVDDEIVFVFYGEPDEDLVDVDEDTFVVYDSTADSFAVYLGSEDFDAEDTEVSVYSGSHNALYDGDLTEAADITDAFEGLTFSDLRTEFGILDTIITLRVFPLTTLTAGTLALGIVVTRRRGMGA
ncbi:hypothetical protein [Natronocalculus amylovorans]|uniref:Uncharacterized protein n=1 Tax=Natronocalculus amylovorans TaxID=2917812 RepID=A0AAE3K9G2_9EURY|nr:hypothetical protein [Natronocalculus amylovorans]MCL9818322.1 hypothetical protein [Natronocalculus amylovorans]